MQGRGQTRRAPLALARYNFTNKQSTELRNRLIDGKTHFSLVTDAVPAHLQSLRSTPIEEKTPQDSE